MRTPSQFEIRENLVRIQDGVRVKHLLQVGHDMDKRGVLGVVDDVTLLESEAVLGADGTVASFSELVQERLDPRQNLRARKENMKQKRLTGRHNHRL